MGVLKANFLEAVYENKLKFPGGRGGGARQKTFRGGSMDIFWNCTLYEKNSSVNVRFKTFVMAFRA